MAQRSLLGIKCWWPFIPSNDARFSQMVELFISNADGFSHMIKVIIGNNDGVGL